MVAFLILLGIALTFLGLARAGVNGKHSSHKASPKIRPVSYTVHRLKRASAAASATPETVAASVLRRYGGTHVLSASADSRTSKPAGTVLHFVVDATGLGEGAIRGQWESDLVAGAVADSFAGTPDQVVTTSIDVRLPDGDIQPDTGGGMGNVAPNQAFSTVPADAIRSSVADGLAAHHLSLVSLDVLDAVQPAPAVIVATGDPLAAAAAARETILAIFGQNPPKYEGYYFEVRDATGDPILVQSAAFRTGAGRLWFSPKVKDALSVDYLGGSNG